MDTTRVIKPHVGIARADNNNQEIIKEILAGLEEEGVPWELKYFEEREAIKLAYHSASESTLQVGIGVGKNGDVAVHYTRLPLSEPLLYISSNEGYRGLWRILGANAARIVKGIPIRPLVKEKQEYKQEETTMLDLDMEYITSKVIKVLNELLAKD
ncbi:MAG: hypothetical protein PWQ67_2454 [Clostridia bacterium]|nr:hypothetical protein [Clostridia bacterium]